MRHFLLALTVLSILAPATHAATYEIDPAHSQVAFKIRHLVSKVAGRFTKFSGTIDYEPGKAQSWSVTAHIDPAAIDTDNSQRDTHLKSPDFFDVAKCPEMTFKSSRVTDVKGETAKLHGELTMHCVTKPVVLDLEVGGAATDPWGAKRAGFSAKTTLNRKDFGLVWNKALDNGGVLIGDEVSVSIEVEGVAKAPASR